MSPLFANREGSGYNKNCAIALPPPCKNMTKKIYPKICMYSMSHFGISNKALCFCMSSRVLNATWSSFLVFVPMTVAGMRLVEDLAPLQQPKDLKGHAILPLDF